LAEGGRAGTTTIGAGRKDEKGIMVREKRGNKIGLSVKKKPGRKRGAI